MLVRAVSAPPVLRLLVTREGIDATDADQADDAALAAVRSGAYAAPAGQGC